MVYNVGDRVIITDDTETGKIRGTIGKSGIFDGMHNGYCNIVFDIPLVDNGQPSRLFYEHEFRLDKESNVLQILKEIDEHD